jgi:hypothetical protein
VWAVVRALRLICGSVWVGMKHRAACAVCLGSLGVLAGCGLAEPAPNSGSEGGGAGATVPESSVVDSATRVTLDRTPCYGACPVYSLSIGGDGTVAYFGQSAVNVKGAASKQVPVSDVQALVDLMVRADYFELSLPAACPEGFISDAPGATTSLTLGGRTHTVVDHGNPCAPAVLQMLEDAIDEVTGSVEWVQCDTPGGACCAPEVNPFFFPCAL